MYLIDQHSGNTASYTGPICVNGNEGAWLMTVITGNVYTYRVNGKVRTA